MAPCLPVCAGVTGELAVHHGDAEAVVTVENAIAAVEDNGDRFLLPELLRVGGELELLVGGAGNAEPWLRRSMDLARAQGAVSWQLRTAASLLLLADAGRLDEACLVVSAVLTGMDGEPSTGDMREALRWIR